MLVRAYKYFLDDVDDIVLVRKELSTVAQKLLLVAFNQEAKKLRVSTLHFSCYPVLGV